MEDRSTYFAADLRRARAYLTAAACLLKPAADEQASLEHRYAGIRGVARATDLIESALKHSDQTDPAVVADLDLCRSVRDQLRDTRRDPSSERAAEALAAATRIVDVLKSHD
jgi:hypothetical protein